MVEFNDLEKDKWVWTDGVTSIYPAREAYKLQGVNVGSAKHM